MHSAHLMEQITQKAKSIISQAMQLETRLKGI
jgi:hypothetical protein